MKIKNLKKHHQDNSLLTVSDLRKNVTSSVYGRFKIKLHTIVGQFKRFYRSYKLPTVATLIFLFILSSLLVVRQLERTSLLALIDDVTDGSRYTSLLNADQADEFVRNDTAEESNQGNTQQDSSAQEAQQDNSTQSNSTPFSLDTTNSSSTNPTPSTVSEPTSNDDSSNNENDNDTPPNTLPVPPFGSSIESFTRGSTALQCSNPSKRNKGTCSKVYSFNSDIQTVNGPGTVRYAWQSNISSGNGNGTFSVGSGSALTAVSKQVSLGCNKDATFTIQISILSPITSSSNTQNINHNCNEL